MLVTTTDDVKTHRITAYHGMVTGEAIMGANLFKDMFASVRDIVGGRSGAYENEMVKAREIAMAEMQAAAAAMNADAVIGVDIDYEVVGDKGSMLMVTVAGTAVSLEPLTGKDNNNSPWG